MEKQSALAQPEKDVVPAKLLPACDLFDRFQALYNSIARRAYSKRPTPFLGLGRPLLWHDTKGLASGGATGCLRAGKWEPPAFLR